MISNKKAIEAAETIVQFCEEQSGCQNCIFREFGCGSWNCHIDAFDIADVVRNYEAKKKNHGYL